MTPAPKAVGALAVADAEESALDRATTEGRRPPVAALERRFVRVMVASVGDARDARETTRRGDDARNADEATTVRPVNDDETTACDMEVVRANARE